MMTPDFIDKPGYSESLENSSKDHQPKSGGIKCVLMVAGKDINDPTKWHKTELNPNELPEDSGITLRFLKPQEDDFKKLLGSTSWRVYHNGKWFQIDPDDIQSVD